MAAASLPESNLSSSLPTSNVCLCGLPTTDPETVSAFSPYNYARLPSSTSFRVFVLEAAGPDEAVSGRLNVLDLSAQPPPSYNALSYTWTRSQAQSTTNDALETEIPPVLEVASPPVNNPFAWKNQPKPHHVFIDGGSVLAVTCNLFSALSRLRSATRELVLFADALSIDQGTDSASLEERAQQIRLMGDIFREAELVHADLGDYNDGAVACMENLKSVARIDDARWNATQSDPRAYGTLLPQDITSSLWFWRSSIALCTRPWWKRLWALQEVLLPRSVQFLVNTTTISRTDLDRGLQRLWAYYASFEIFKSALAGDDELRWAVYFQSVHAWSWTTLLDDALFAANGARFLEIMGCTGVYETTVPHDQIFALLGLATAEERDNINIDYQQSYSNLLLQFARHTVDRGSVQSLLHILQPQKQEWLPSWVFDPLHKSITDNRFQALFVGLVNSLQAGGSGVPKTIYDSTGKRLRLHAIFLGQVKIVTGACPPPAPVERYWSSVGRWCLQARTIFSKHCLNTRVQRGGDVCYDDFWSTLTIGNRLRVKGLDNIALQRSISKKHVQAFSAWLDDNESDVFDGEGVEAGIGNEVQAVCDYISTSCVNRRFAITDDDRLCLVSKATTVGDRVAIFMSVDMPFTVRLCPGVKEGEDDCHTLVDSAYVHGVMDGELIDDRVHEKTENIWLV